MSWTAPPTFVSGAVLTAAQMNILGGDISFLVASGNTVATSQTTTSATYGDLTTVGPAVTATTGANAIVILSANISNSASDASLMGYAISGATTLAASDNTALGSANTGFGIQSSYIAVQTGLTAGSNTFTAKYRTTGGTATFVNRVLTVFALP